MNLLTETKRCLEENGKKLEDIKWIGGEDFYTDTNISDILNVEYDSGFGAQEVASDLIVVGEDWWLERHEYDGSEWWEFKTVPNKPEVKRDRFNVVGGMWWKLSDMD